MIEKEVTSLAEEMFGILKNTEFNGKKVFSSTDWNIQSGPDGKDRYAIPRFWFGTIATVTDREDSFMSSVR